MKICCRIVIIAGVMLFFLGCATANVKDVVLMPVHKGDEKIGSILNKEIQKKIITEWSIYTPENSTSDILYIRFPPQQRNNIDEKLIKIEKLVRNATNKSITIIPQFRWTCKKQFLQSVYEKNKDSFCKILSEDMYYNFQDKYKTYDLVVEYLIMQENVEASYTVGNFAFTTNINITEQMIKKIENEFDIAIEMVIKRFEDIK
ncbi:hypothetical protein [Treponema pedis]|uniref:hypothetical protein n=1 Tax=Treponema pedis TaxID=409322 RepID=UPI003D1F41EC